MLQRRALTATLWTVVDAVLRQALQLAVTVALARLLTPAQFGVVALLALFSGIAVVLIDGGFTTALIQAETISEADRSTVFYMQVGVALALAVGLLACSPLIADLFSEPLVTSLAWLSAATLVINGISSVPTALLIRALDFRTQMIAGVAGTVVSGALAVALAANGAGAWALAGQSLCAAAVTCVVIYALTTWRPSLAFRRAALSRLHRYGRYMLAVGALNLAAGIPNAVVGKLYGAATLGQYGRAFSTQYMVNALVQSTFGRVVFPVFSSVQNDEARLRRGLGRAIRFFVALCAPAMLGLWAVAEPFTVVVFGEKWRPSVPLLQIMTLGGLFWPFSIVNSTVLYATGRSKQFFELTLFATVVGVVALIPASFFGVTGIAWAYVASAACLALVFVSASGKVFRYGLLSQLRDTAPSLGPAGVMAAAVWAVAQATRLPAAVELALLVAVGFVVYAALSVAFNKPLVIEAFELVRGRLSKAAPASASPSSPPDDAVQEDLVHIVPSLAPIDGVGAYARELAEAMQRSTGKASQFIAAAGPDNVACIAKNAGELDAALARKPRNPVVIHLSHYGFANRGAALWLVFGIRRALKRYPARPLYVVFHELYAVGPPSGSAFYLSPVHRWITWSLLQLCTAAIVTTPRRLQRLLDWRPDAPVTLLPVFSNVGESAASARASLRPPSAVVFGSAPTRRSVYSEAFAGHLSAVLEKFNIRLVVDIGPDVTLAPNAIGGVRVERCGVLSPAEVREKLGAARFGLIVYPPDELGKSGVVAAYAANGVIPIVFQLNGDASRSFDAPGVLDGSVPPMDCSDEALDRSQAAIVGWYSEHALEKQVAFWNRTLAIEPGS